MKIIYEDELKAILRFDRGEELMSGLINFAKSSDLPAGTFTGLGACDFVELSYYDLGAREYVKKEFKEDLEITNVTGNISWQGENPAVHMHGTFSKKNFSAIGGHVSKMLVSGTCEVHLQKIAEIIVRGHDEETGLNLLS